MNYKIKGKRIDKETKMCALKEITCDEYITDNQEKSPYDDTVFAKRADWSMTWRLRFTERQGWPDKRELALRARSMIEDVLPFVSDIPWAEHAIKTFDDFVQNKITEEQFKLSLNIFRESARNHKFDTRYKFDTLRAIVALLEATVDSKHKLIDCVEFASDAIHWKEDDPRNKTQALQDLNPKIVLEETINPNTTEPLLQNVKGKNRPKEYLATLRLFENGIPPKKNTNI